MAFFKNLLHVKLNQLLHPLSFASLFLKRLDGNLVPVRDSLDLFFRYNARRVTDVTWVQNLKFVFIMGMVHMHKFVTGTVAGLS